MSVENNNENPGVLTIFITTAVVVVGSLTISGFVRECRNKSKIEDSNQRNAIIQERYEIDLAARTRTLSLEEEIATFLSGTSEVCSYGEDLTRGMSSQTIPMLNLFGSGPSDDMAQVMNILAAVKPSGAPRGWFIPSMLEKRLFMPTIEGDAPTIRGELFVRGEGLQKLETKPKKLGDQSVDASRAVWNFDDLSSEFGTLKVSENGQNNIIPRSFVWKHINDYYLAVHTDKKETEFVAFFVRSYEDRQLSDANKDWEFARLIFRNRFASISKFRYERYIVVKPKL